MRKTFRRLGRDQSGATAVEYGLILSLIFLALVVAVQGMAGETLRLWTGVSSEAAVAHGNPSGST